MRRSISALILTLFCAACANAGPKKFLRDWKFLLGESFIAAAESADGYSTCRNMSWGYVESSPLARGSRSCGATMGHLASGFAFYTALNVVEQKLFRNDRNKAIRSLTPWMVPAAVVPIHAQAAGHNFGLAPPAGPMR